MMGLRALFWLLLVAGGLAAVLYFTDEKPPQQRVAESAVLSGRSLLECKKLRWFFRERPPIEVSRDAEGHFQLSEPIVDLASFAYMKQIVDAWDSAQMQASRLVDDEAGRQEAGLLPPELTFVVTFRDDQRITVEIGGIGPLADKETRYLRIDGRIYVASHAIYESMRVGLEDMRERTVFRHAFAQADEVKVDQKMASGHRETLHLKLVDGAWRLLAPVQGRADPVATQRFVRALVSLRVTDFAPGALRLPAGPPDFDIEVSGVLGREQLRLWRHSGAVFGLLPGRNIGFSSDNREYVSVFEHPVEDLRARMLLPLGANIMADLRDVLIDPGQGREALRIRREEDQEWRLQEPIDWLALPTPCLELAEALQRLMAHEFVPGATADDQQYGLQPAKRLVVLAQGKGETKPTTLWFGASLARGDEQFVYCCRADEPHVIALVSKSWVDRLQRPWTDYCDRTVLRQQLQVERLVLRAAGKERVFALDNGIWTRVGDPTPRPEIGELCTDYLSDLVGEATVSVRGQQRPPSFEILLQWRNKDTFATLRVFDFGDDQPLCVQGPLDAPVVFRMKPLLSSQLRALWQ
jgi:hypothetical protein